ncbi:tRNA (adenosine(37)-N6)-threonylcarbamoyltransferase complex ATPase subunit type 1 TsaE [Marinobacterium sp. LSUCC0821]|uniref:tRNA (adenosine(37)-N6)-threonylcarbamoyltransferase complex ATPase subunit type 1 TsaE n=1 Tax=Marinobacterium sp. LSUCC0821 TaxID=2668067 RepID=UPI0014513064|nr:tRNA (adenosine(37)-N6)-threonylcarbamoyltransferase complex ATPase subunit type 1 TsaE [Marinobacterium sp. LSUCC0821]QJD70302.1 tRNA (adenosine(37)-N6)-threonylcarbamoyltransferase complex ATPase subunit type 1 TsaE [Marinobacterium sp. LSUCC0821]
MTADLVWNLADEEATLRAGKALGEVVLAGVIFLEGNLGMGKTTLTRGLIQGLGHRGAVKSPTYTLVEPYLLDGRQIYHFDLYRLSEPEELEYMGIRDYFDQEALCLVEWAERGEGMLPTPDLEIKLEPLEQGRKLSLFAMTAKGRDLLQQLPVSV